MANKKLKPVLPSLREKKRYLVFEVISKHKLNDANVVSSAITNCVTHFVGRLGAAKAGIMVLNNKWDAEKQRGIARVNHKNVDVLKASLLFANNIEGKEVIVRSLGVSGMLNKAESRFLKN